MNEPDDDQPEPMTQEETISDMVRLLADVTRYIPRDERLAMAVTMAGLWKKLKKLQKEA